MRQWHTTERFRRFFRRNKTRKLKFWCRNSRVEQQPIAMLIGGDALDANGVQIDYARRMIYAKPNQIG